MPHTKAFCIHGHFYQPPREDPLTGLIPSEPGAAPYHNWNERIYAECYRPNADLGNFERISFNVGPTLFSWLAQHDRTTYRRIIAQDRNNFKRHGFGNALAQGYHHTILPLAPFSDKEIQISWGIADFEWRYNHKPEGFWLPETAVDLDTLTVLAAHGIRFTILAPWQADVESLDPTEPYLVNLPGGRTITVFFYQGDLSAKVSFDPATTSNADDFFLHELSNHFNQVKAARGEAQLLIIASDGELYGHHQPSRERFLAHLLDGASAKAEINTTTPILWLKDHPARQFIKIRENTSWSCHHGVLRWSGECACSSLDSRWKVHLRRALHHLAADLDRLFYEEVYPYISKPRSLQQRYIHVMLGSVTADKLISEMASHDLTREQVWRIHMLLEAQRERQRMFTSCGWFFEDFNRIEPRNNLAYAAQAVRLARIATGIDLAPQAIAEFEYVCNPISKICGATIFNEYLHRTWAMNTGGLSRQ